MQCIGFLIIRLMLLFGSFNYGEKGILDKTLHEIIYIFPIQNLLIQNGFNIEASSGFPAPIPLYNR